MTTPYRTAESTPPEGPVTLTFRRSWLGTFIPPICVAWAVLVGLMLVVSPLSGDTELRCQRGPEITCTLATTKFKIDFGAETFVMNRAFVDEVAERHRRPTERLNLCGPSGCSQFLDTEMDQAPAAVARAAQSFIAGPLPGQIVLFTDSHNLGALALVALVPLLVTIPLWRRIHVRFDRHGREILVTGLTAPLPIADIIRVDVLKLPEGYDVAFAIMGAVEITAGKERTVSLGLRAYTRSSASKVADSVEKTVKAWRKSG